MLNQVVLVGRVILLEGSLLCIRPEDNFIIDVTVPDTLKESMKAHVVEGGIIGIKGKLSHNNKVIAERVTYLQGADNNEQKD